MLFQRLVYPHFRRLAPAADGTSTAGWIGLPNGLIDHRSLLANKRQGPIPEGNGTKSPPLT